jgi:hypothetical protein
MVSSSMWKGSLGYGGSKAIKSNSQAQGGSNRNAQAHDTAGVMPKGPKLNRVAGVQVNGLKRGDEPAALTTPKRTSSWTGAPHAPAVEKIAKGGGVQKVGPNAGR